MRDIITKLEELNVEKEQLNEGLGDMAHEAEKDHEVQMARSDLYKSAKYAVSIHKMLKDHSEMDGIEGWVASKITKAADYLGSVKHYMEGQKMQDVELAVVPVAGDMTDAMTMPESEEPIEEVHESIEEGMMNSGPCSLKCKVCGDMLGQPTTDCEYDSMNHMQENWMLVDLDGDGDHDIAVAKEEVEEIEEAFDDDVVEGFKKGDRVTVGGEDGYNDFSAPGKILGLSSKGGRARVRFQNNKTEIVPIKMLTPESIEEDEDVIGNIIAKLGKAGTGKKQSMGTMGTMGSKSSKDVIGDIIAKLPKDDKPAVSAVTKQKAANQMALPKPRPRSMAQDTTKIPNMAHSIATAKANQKAMMGDSKFSEWGKK